MSARLPLDVLAFIQRAKAQGARALDPNVLDRLARSARNAWDGAWVALQAPMAPDTWELRATLKKTDAQVQGSIRFDRPIRIVGMLPIVTLAATTGGDPIPTADDLEINLTVDNERNFTQGSQDLSGGQTSDFVTLSALSILTPRLVGRVITSPVPNLSAVIRGKRGAGVYAPVDVRLAFFTEYLQPSERG